MKHELENPFSVTKATEFSDQEIKDYWVDFNTTDHKSIGSILNPSEFLPKFVIGGKGCGKTHILRNYSFPLQKIRFNNDVSRLLQEDGYIGFYSVLHGMNSSRFEGKGVDSAEWASVFEYYFELYISDNFLKTIQEILIAISVSHEKETELVKQILNIFCNCDNITDVDTVEKLKAFLYNLRRKIDVQVLNAAFTRKLNYDDVKVLFTPGDLLFGMPAAIATVLSEFANIKFIYIFDEYEKLFEWQKKFVNTLVWDKKNPVTFWIGARRYGYVTRETKSGEVMRIGSEFQEVNLDRIIRDNEDFYKKFAEELCANRLLKYYERNGQSSSSEEHLKKEFFAKFEKYNEADLISTISERGKNKELKHIKELKQNLKEAVELKKGREIVPEGDVKTEIDNIADILKQQTEDNPLEQKYKLFLFYRNWYSSDAKTPFKTIAEDVNKEYSKNLDKKKSEFSEIKDKRKKDFIAQLARENNIKNREYSGIEKIIELSQGNPRTFILTLKKIIEYSRIRGERPLDEGSVITLDAQYLAIFETAKWFYDDAEVIGNEGKIIYDSLKRLTDYLMIYRFCDKPTETSVSSFYVKEEELSAEALRTIKNMDVHSIVIKDDGGRKEKNTGRTQSQYQINKILAPLWNLPIIERGTVYLNKEVAESIFDEKQHDNFEKYYKVRKAMLNAPDFLKHPPSTTKQGSIF
jgi:hypothetical protein